MKLAMLTTETTHHAYFARELSAVRPIDLIVSETHAPTPPFATAHPFEDRRNDYERQAFFGGNDVRLADVAEALEVRSANAREAVDALRKLAPDVIVVFGTGKIGRDLIELCPQRIVNLHGGDPERYRGLDTHMWAIYHGEFDPLITTLHHLDEGLDTGDVILQTAVSIAAGMPLFQLRARNTEACIELTLGALDMFERFGRLPSRPQRGLGRYYSFMPAELKGICVGRFEAHTKGMAR